MNRDYQCVTPTIEGFVQQLAIAYVARRYFFYVSGYIPDHKNPVDVDTKLLQKFEVNISKWARYRRKQRTAADGRPLANTQYLRFERYFVLLCTEGHHKFFDVHQQYQQSKNIWIRNRQYRDIRRHPIVVAGYSIGYRNGHVTVRMSRPAYQELKRHFETLAKSARIDALEREFRRAPFEPYGGVTNQMFCILRATNRIRKIYGRRLVSHDCVRTRRKSLRPFAEPVYPLPGYGTNGE